MQHSRRFRKLGLLAAPLAVAAAFFYPPWQEFAPPAEELPRGLPSVVAVVPTTVALATATPLPPVATVTVEATPALLGSTPSATAAREFAPTAIPTSGADVLPNTRPAATSESTPTPRPAGTPLRVGIQVGHWRSEELPDELARLRTSSGAFAAGYAESEVNLAIARQVVALLEERGVVVDLLPATVPVDYDADAFVALHADGSPSAGARGFKLSTPWRTSRAAQHLLDALTAEYAAATGMPLDDAITFNMRGYYAFNYRRHDHAIARTTPGVILEMGFLTSATDRAMLIEQPDRVAIGVANGILRYLAERDPTDGAALLTPEFKTQRAASPQGVDVLAAPRDDAAVLLHVGADRRFNPIQEREGWYQVFARSGERRIIGWVRKDQLVETNDPTPTPPPSTDS